jgi:SlyX protein
VESKITDLEIRLTHQEASLNEINLALHKQHNMLESLKEDIASLKKQIRDMNTGYIADPSQETPPPHY